MAFHLFGQGLADLVYNLGLCPGWLNVAGQFAHTAGNGAMLANHIASMWWLGNRHAFSRLELLLAYASATCHPWHSSHLHHLQPPPVPSMRHVLHTHKRSLPAHARHALPGPASCSRAAAPAPSSPS